MARFRQLSVAFALVALLWLAYSVSAQAQTYANEGAAYSACVPKAAADVAALPNQRRAPICRHENVSGSVYPNSYWACFETRPNTSVPWNGGIGCTSRFDYPADKQCSKLPSLTSTFNPKSGSISCSGGCEQAWFKNADGTSTGQYLGTVCTTDKMPETCGANFYWNSLLSVCEPVKEECSGGQKPNSSGKCADEPCPEGMVQQPDGTCKAKENECPAGEVKGPDGSCVKKPDACGAGTAQGADGTCKPDKDGDGVPDDEDADDDGKDDKASFSGGDDCNSPPSCSGDPIMCGQARIQWRIDCNTRKNRTIAGGACSTPPICTGEKCDAMEYSSLLMQWRTACATEKLLAKDGGGSEEGQPDWTKVGGMSQDPGAGASDSDTNVVTEKVLSTADLDQSGFGGGGGSCPGFVAAGGSPGISSGFQSVLASPPAFFCDFISYIRAVIILSASVLCCYILSRGAP